MCFSSTLKILKVKVTKTCHQILTGILLVSLMSSEFKRNLGEHRIPGSEIITQVTKSSFYYYKKTSCRTSS